MRCKPLADALRRKSLLLLTIAATGCGLADDERDEKNKYVYISFYDPDFGRYCLEHFDLDADGRISRYEAQRIIEMDCSQQGISSLEDIGEFTRLRELRCSDNSLSQLDLRECTLLERLDCSANALVSLDVRELRSLHKIDCSSNLLTSLDLGSNPSMDDFDGRGNRFVTLDFTSCGTALQADVRSNPSLSTVYCREGQSIRADGTTDVVGS